jgi:hypothetical protein
MHFSPPLLGFDSEDWPVIFGKPEVISEAGRFERNGVEVTWSLELGNKLGNNLA